MLKNILLFVIYFISSNLLGIHGGYTGFTPGEFNVPQQHAYVPPVYSPAQVIQEMYTGVSALDGSPLNQQNPSGSAMGNYIAARNNNDIQPTGAAGIFLAPYPTGPGLSTPPRQSDGIFNSTWKMGKLLEVPNLSNDDKVALLNAFCDYDSGYMDKLSDNDFRSFYGFIVNQPDNVQSKVYDTSCPANYDKIFTRWSTPVTQSTSAQAAPTDQKPIESACPFVYQWQGPNVIPQVPQATDIPTSSVSALQDYINNTVKPYQTKINTLITKFNDEKNGFKVQANDVVSNWKKNDPYLRTLNDSLAKINDANTAFASASAAYKACAANPPSDKAKGYCSTEPLKAYVDSANALYDALANSMAILAKCNVNAPTPQRSSKLITVTQSSGKTIGLEYPKGNVLQFNTVTNYDKTTFEQNVKDCTTNYIKSAYKACFDQFTSVPALIKKASDDYNKFVADVKTAGNAAAKNDQDRALLNGLYMDIGGTGLGVLLMNPEEFIAQTVVSTLLGQVTTNMHTPADQATADFTKMLNDNLSNDVGFFDASNHPDCSGGKFFTSCAYHAGKVGYDALMIMGGGVVQVATQFSDTMSALSHGQTPGEAAASSGHGAPSWSP